MRRLKDNDRLCTNHMTNKRLVMNESYKHWRNEMHHSWPIFKFKILLLTYKTPVTIIVTGILWWCHWYKYCTSDITTLVPQREKLMLHLLWPTCHQRFSPFFTLLGIKDNGEQECFFRDLPLRVVEKIFCIFPSTCMFDWIALDLFPLHRLKGASKLFMTIKTDWRITSATRKNDVAVHRQLQAEVCMNVPALKPFPTWTALKCLCRSTSHFTSITCGIISFDHQGQRYFVIQLDL